ncbi:putative glycosyltransferase EpsF [Phycisphaerae bacterium RAS1]|nr:putative glycosyltransferase EpsF [Phycisphaerae bacterium RAS1]
MRVMLLVTDLERGGTPLRLARLAHGLRELGVEVAVGCLAPPGPVSRELDADGIQTFACGAGSARDVAAILRLAGHVRRIRPDLIHSTLTHANVAARLVGFLLGVPVITSTATIEMERRWHAPVERLTAFLDRGHIVNSAALAAHVVQSFGRRVENVFVTPPLIATVGDRLDRSVARAALGIEPSAFVLAWAGRLDPVKRVDLLIRCTELLESSTQLLIAGDGPDCGRIASLAAASPATGRVRLLGWQRDLSTLYSAADALVFPSRTEGLPNVVMEAMAFGLPVVASDIPPHRELAGDSPRLALVGGEDAADWAAAVHRLRADLAAAAAMALLARRYTAPFQHAACCAAATIRVYETVTSKR